MSLLSNIDKKPFQVFTIKHGIETVKVKIPLELSESFEQKIKAIGDATMTELLLIVKNFGGKI